MKTQFIAFTALLVALNMTSCKDKNESDETSIEVSTTTTQDSIDLYDESSGTGSTPGNDVSGSNSGSVENTSDNSGNTSTSSPTSKNATTGKKAPVKKGYSAPDGTDAENHDGDMYTKHDTTRMPSGPPIK